MNRSLPLRLGAVLIFSLLTPVFVPLLPDASAAEAPTEGLRHGSRSKAADGTMVVYDKVYGVFLVPDRKDTYWIGDRFYQYENGVWLTATAVAGPWELTAQHLVPEVAQRRYAPLRTSVTAKLPSGREAVYEPRLKVYKVAGRKGVFLYEGRYYRQDGGLWLESSKDDGPWAPTSAKILPLPLRKAVPAPEADQKVTLPSGETVVFSGETNLFVVEGKPGVLLFDGTFYQKRDGKWMASAASGSGFQELEPGKVPAPVRMKDRKLSGADKAKPGKSGGDKTGHQKKAGEKKNRVKKDAAGAHANKNAKPAADGDEEP